MGAVAFVAVEGDRKRRRGELAAFSGKSDQTQPAAEEGGYSVLDDGSIPVDGAPMDMTAADSAEFDAMLQDMFGEEGSLKAQKNQARRDGQ